MHNQLDNAFLGGLNPACHARLSPHLAMIETTLGDRLYRADERVTSVYFPETSLLSLVSADPNGQTVETFMAGREGAAGLLEVCGSGVATLDCIVQVDGRVRRVPAPVFRDLVRADADLGAAVWRMIELQMAESRQSGLCLTFHPVEARLARWLLESHERSGGRNPLPMTQEFLSNMLGVQRTTINHFAALLQQRGLIHYNRGKLHLIDPVGLEVLACECRSVTREQRDRLGFALAPVTAATAA